MAPQDESLNAIIAAGVSHHYGKKVQALNDLTLNIPAGKINGLIGPDGVGKSTLLGLISGVKKLQQGKIISLEQNVSHATDRARLHHQMAYMPQGLGSNLYGDLSVAENISFFATLYDLPKEEAQQQLQLLAEKTGLSPFLDRKAKNLSGGMKQKLGLCCALIHNPSLLILDEPTTGVDPLSRLNFWELIREMHALKQDMTIIVATAYMAEALQFHHLIMLDEGETLAEGSPQSLQQQTGCESLEEAYVALLPEAKRQANPTLDTANHYQRDKITVQASKLTKKFGDFTAVNEVDFEIGNGEIFGFLGPNGCGKSTTMKMLTGLLPITSGDAKLFGELVETGSLALRKRIGYMSQSFSLYSELTVLENLRLHAELFDLRDSKAAMEAAIGLCQLEPHANQKSGALPMGLKQRLSLAVATLHGPELLILDEPTSGVDPVARNEFWVLIQKLSKEQGVTVFVSTHYMNEALNCHRMVLMNGGRILACDSPKAIMRRYDKDNLDDVFIHLMQQDNERATA